MKEISRNSWSQFVNFWTIRKLLIVGILSVLAVWCLIENFAWAELSANAYTELLGILVTVLVIDTLNERRARRTHKERLIREMGSSDNGIALRAVGELRAHSWLGDGSLYGAALFGADLREADLREADLRDADMYKSNLRGTRLSERQLLQLNTLEGATMPEGNRYDGRFNLAGDIEFASKQGKRTDLPEDLARFYGISIQEYLRGQEWAQENLYKIGKVND